MTVLIKYEAARAALSAAVNVDEVKDIHNMAAAMQAYARQSNDRQMEADAREIRERAVRRLGEMIKAQKETGGLNKGTAGMGDHNVGKATGGLKNNPPVDRPPTLAEAGIDKNLANAARKAAAKTEAEFEKELKRMREPKPRSKAKKPKDVVERQEKIVAFADAGMSPVEISVAVGVGRRMVDRVMEVEKARRQGPEPEIDPATLSKSAQGKLAAAIRAHKKKLDQEFNFKVTEGIRKWVDEVTLPAHVKELQDAQDLLRSRRYGVMPRKIFTLIRACLHTDSRKSVSDKRLNEAFHEFSSRERLLLSEEDAPTITMTFPRSWAEAAEWKRKVKEQRKAKQSRAGTAGEVAR